MEKKQRRRNFRTILTSLIILPMGALQQSQSIETVYLTNKDTIVRFTKDLFKMKRNSPALKTTSDSRAGRISLLTEVNFDLFENEDISNCEQSYIDQRGFLHLMCRNEENEDLSKLKIFEFFDEGNNLKLVFEKDLGYDIGDFYADFEKVEKKLNINFIAISKDDFIIFGKNEEILKFPNKNLKIKKFTSVIKFQNFTQQEEEGENFIAFDYNRELDTESSPVLILADFNSKKTTSIELGPHNIGTSIKNILDVFISNNNHIFISYRKKNSKNQAGIRIFISDCNFEKSTYSITGCDEIDTVSPILDGTSRFYEEKNKNLKIAIFTSYSIRICDYNGERKAIKSCSYSENKLTQLQKVKVDRIHINGNFTLNLRLFDPESKLTTSIFFAFTQSVFSPGRLSFEKIEDRGIFTAAASDSSRCFLIRKNSYSVFKPVSSEEHVIINAGDIIDKNTTIHLSAGPKSLFTIQVLLLDYPTSLLTFENLPVINSFKGTTNWLPINRTALKGNNLQVKVTGFGGDKIVNYDYDTMSLSFQDLDAEWKIRKLMPANDLSQGAVLLEKSGKQFLIYFWCKEVFDNNYWCYKGNQPVSDTKRGIEIVKNEVILEIVYNEFSGLGLIVIINSIANTEQDSILKFLYWHNDDHISSSKEIKGLKADQVEFRKTEEKFSFWVYIAEKTRIDVYSSKTSDFSQMSSFPTIKFEEFDIGNINKKLFCPTGIHLNPLFSDRIEIPSSCNGIFRIFSFTSQSLDNPVKLITSDLDNNPYLGQGGSQKICPMGTEYLILNTENRKLYSKTPGNFESYSNLNLQNFNFGKFQNLFCLKNSPNAVISGVDNQGKNKIVVIRSAHKDQRNRIFTVKDIENEGELVRVTAAPDNSLILVFESNRGNVTIKRVYLNGPMFYVMNTQSGSVEYQIEVISSCQSRNRSLVRKFKANFEPQNFKIEILKNNLKTPKNGNFSLDELINPDMPIYDVFVEPLNDKIMLKPRVYSLENGTIDGEINTPPQFFRKYRNLFLGFRTDSRKSIITIFENFKKVKKNFIIEAICENFDAEVDSISGNIMVGFSCNEKGTHTVRYSLINFNTLEMKTEVVDQDFEVKSIRVGRLDDLNFILLASLKRSVSAVFYELGIIDNTIIRPIPKLFTNFNINFMDFINIDSNLYLIYCNSIETIFRIAQFHKAGVSPNPRELNSIELNMTKPQVENFECRSYENTKNPECIANYKGRDIAVFEITTSNFRTIIIKSQKLFEKGLELFRIGRIDQIRISEDFLAVKMLDFMSREYIQFYNRKSKSKYLWTALNPDNYTEKAKIHGNNDKTQTQIVIAENKFQNETEIRLLFVDDFKAMNIYRLRNFKLEIDFKEEKITSDSLSNYQLVVKNGVDVYKYVKLDRLFKITYRYYIPFLIWVIVAIFIFFLILVNLILSRRSRMKEVKADDHYGTIKNCDVTQEIAINLSNN